MEDAPQPFNPSENICRDNQIFGLPYNADESKVILLPVPWDATCTGKSGACEAPEAIQEASYDIDLYDELYPEAYKKGVFMEHPSGYWKETNKLLRPKARKYLTSLQQTTQLSVEAEGIRDEINLKSEELLRWVKVNCADLLVKGKIVGVVGGDHSAPLGLMHALAETNTFGILHIDAHADLREAYLGLRYSHASVMFNALQLPQVSKLVQVGIRDYCHQERKRMDQYGNRICTFSNDQLNREVFNNTPWHSICDEIIRQLPDKVYISFDIDGLPYQYCTHTGTPVPGGPDYDKIIYLIELLARSGRKIMGFDLCEVNPETTGWNAFVGAKVLYKLSLAAIEGNH